MTCADIATALAAVSVVAVFARWGTCDDHTSPAPTAGAEGDARRSTARPGARPPHTP